MSGRIPAFCCLVSLLALSGCNSYKRTGSLRQSNPVSAAWGADLKGADSLLTLLGSTLGSVASKSAPDDSAAREYFQEARLRYKRQEFLWESGYSALAARLNGPPDDADEKSEGGDPVPPTGFQVLEERLYSRPPAAPAEILKVAADMRALLAKASGAAVALSDSSLVDAVRLELFRLAFLGTTSFDSPAALRSLPETRAALEGIDEALQGRFRGRPEGRDALARFRSRIQSAAAYLDGRSDFASFDRAAFLTAGMEPLYGALADLQTSLAVPLPTEARAYSPAAHSLFSASAWDPAFFAPASARHTPAERIDLGRKLFFDPILSGSGTRSCAVCHAPEQAFTDGRPKSLAVDGHKMVARNAPTLIDAAFQKGVFADLRAADLEEQAGMVIQNPAEMGGDLDSAAHRLNADPEYVHRFRQAFTGDSAETGGNPAVSPVRIRRAVAAYVRTLVSLASPWDRFVRGDSSALTPEARHGFNLFMGKANCAACHFAPLFNGTRPPFFAETELEVIGTPGRVSGGHLQRYFPDPDSGRMAQDHSARSLRAFKTPTLRNVEYTAPYMHNGVFATLEQVVDFYDAGGGAGVGLDIPNQTLASDSLHLDAGEKHALVAFLKALSDTSGTTARPPRAQPRRYASQP